MATHYTAEITDPITGKTVTAHAETPEDLEVAIDQYLATNYPAPNFDSEDAACSQSQDRR